MMLWLGPRGCAKQVRDSETKEQVPGKTETMAKYLYRLADATAGDSAYGESC